MLRHWPTRPRPATRCVRRLTAMAGGQFRQPNDPNGSTGFGRALSSVKRGPVTIPRRGGFQPGRARMGAGMKPRSPAQDSSAAGPDRGSGSDDARPAALAPGALSPVISSPGA